MKKAIKLVVAVTMFIGAGAVNATGPTFNAKVVGEKKFRVEVNEVKGSSLMYVENANGQILYKNRSKEDLLRVTFDLSTLSAGDYKVVVKDEAKVQTLPLVVNTDGIELKNDAFDKTFFPVVEKENNEVLVKLLSDESNDLEINIRSLEGRLMTQDKVEGQLGLIGKRYQFSPGTYAVTVKSDDFYNTTYVSIR